MYRQLGSAPLAGDGKTFIARGEQHSDRLAVLPGKEHAEETLATTVTEEPHRHVVGSSKTTNG